MANTKRVAAPQSDETKVEQGHASAAQGEIDPSADTSNRGNEIAARMAAAPVRTLDMAKKESAVKKQGSFVNDDGETEYVDPDELEAEEVHEAIPKDKCLNCKNHGRESQLDSKGFCKRCGFKLNRMHNIQLEPSRKTL